MERTLRLIDQALDAIDADITIPCDANGPSDMTSPTTARPERRDVREIVATVLLAVAAVATAWSSYQAARWNGEQAKTSGRVNAVRVEAARAQGLAEAQTQVDVATFIQWVDARATMTPSSQDFYEERFRAEFKPGLRGVAGHRPPDHPGRTADAVRHGGVPARSDRRRPSELDAEAEALGRAGPPQHPTRRPTTCSAWSSSRWPCSSRA